MKINQLLMQGQHDKIFQIYKDYNAIKNKIVPENDESVFDEIIPVYGQVNDVAEEVRDNNFDTVGAITSLAVLKGPEEIDELFSAARQIKKKLNGEKYEHPFDYTKAELESSFFRDSTLAKHMNYRSKDCVSPKISEWLIDKDISLLGTKFGKFVRKLLGIEVTIVKTPLESITSTTERKNYLKAVEFDTKSVPKEIVGRSLARTSKLGTLALAAIEGFDIKNDIQDGANPFAEIAKGAVKLGTTVGAIGTLGALGSKYYGPVGSVVGTATGTVLGALTARKLDYSSFE